MNQYKIVYSNRKSFRREIYLLNRTTIGALKYFLKSRPKHKEIIHVAIKVGAGWKTISFSPILAELARTKAAKAEAKQERAAAKVIRQQNEGILKSLHAFADYSKQDNIRVMSGIPTCCVDLAFLERKTVAEIVDKAGKLKPKPTTNAYRLTYSIGAGQITYMFYITAAADPTDYSAAIEYIINRHITDRFTFASLEVIIKGTWVGITSDIVDQIIDIASLPNYLNSLIAKKQADSSPKQEQEPKPVLRSYKLILNKLPAASSPAIFEFKAASDEAAMVEAIEYYKGYTRLHPKANILKARLDPVDTNYLSVFSRPNIKGFNLSYIKGYLAAESHYNCGVKTNDK